MSSPTLQDEDRSRLNHSTPIARRTLALQNLPIKFGKVTMATQTVTTALTGLLTTDVVTFGIEKQDTGGATVVERAYVSAAGTLSIKVASAPVGADGIVSYAIFRPTDPA